MVEYAMADLVCLHLDGVGGIEEEPVLYEASTPGIAVAMDLGTETLSDRVTLLSTLSALPEEGLVREAVDRVDEIYEERNVYTLTEEGREHARERRAELESESIVVRTPDSDNRVPLADIDRYLDDNSYRQTNRANTSPMGELAHPGNVFTIAHHRITYV